SGRTSKTPAHRMCGLGFLCVLGARWRPFSARPFSRLLELKNTKTAGSENLLKVPPLGFRVLEFEFADFGG
ncbi:hypothetical protein, partial [Corynebacterium diphtheriae]|uniref:hypothetical protein n=2 Tax=Corynebacterium diphtheriae TaxID=1717 RepID=UPI00036F0B3E